MGALNIMIFSGNFKQGLFRAMLAGGLLTVNAGMPSLAQTQTLDSVPASVAGLKPQGEFITFGFSTADWGRDWDILLLIETLQEIGINQVELGEGHAHEISPALTPGQRTTRRDQFQEAGILVTGMQLTSKVTAEDEASIATLVDNLKQTIRLSHDVGGSGVRVNLGDLKGDTALIANTAKALKEMGEFAIGFGQEIRVEAWAGDTSLDDLVAVLKATNDDQVRIAFGVRNAEKGGEKVKEDFAKVQPYLGGVVLIETQPSSEAAPFAALANLLVEADYDGRVVLTTKAAAIDVKTDIVQQKTIWEQQIKKARTP